MMSAMRSLGNRIRPRLGTAKLPCSAACMGPIPDSSSGGVPKRQRYASTCRLDDSMPHYQWRRRSTSLSLASDVRLKTSWSRYFSSQISPRSCVGGPIRCFLTPYHIHTTAYRTMQQQQPHQQLQPQPQQQQQQRRGIFFSLIDSINNPPFDPLQQSSATVLKHPNEELSELEQKLKGVLQEYSDYMDAMDDPNNHELLVQDFGYEEKIEALQEVYMDMGYWSDALGIEQTKCALYFEKGTDEYADSIHAQGKLWLRQEEFGHSKSLYEEALGFFNTPKSNNQVQVGHVLISLAGWYYFQNQLEVAMEHLHKAEPLLDSNPPLLVKCLDNQGLVHRLWGDYHAALDKYQQALQVVDPVKEEETRHALLMHLGDMYQAIEEPQEALQVYHDLIQEMEQKGGDVGDSAIKGMQGVLWHNIATIHGEFGDYEMALDEFDRAIQLKTEMGGANHPEVAKTWNSLGVLHAGALRQLPKARECFQHALMIARINADDPSTDEDVIHILQNISHIEQQLNR